MSSWPLVQFVDGPSPDANVRYDFNDASAAAGRTVGREFTLGVPTLEGEPDAVGQSWGFRSPSFPQMITGPKAAALESLGALSRELLRPTNWVHFKLNRFTPSVWLKTYRTGGQPLSLDNVYVDTDEGDEVLAPDQWQIPVPLVADAFGYGERVTLDPVTITQAIDGTNPMQVLLPTITGDAPAALRISLTPQTGTTALYGSTWLVACIAGDDPAITFVDLGTGDVVEATYQTSDPIADSDYLGGSYRRTSLPADNVLATRIQGTLPPLPAGQYKALLRSGFTTTNPGLIYRLLRDPNDFGHPATVIDGTVAPASDRLLWVDLQQSSFPFNVDLGLDLVGDMGGSYFELEIGAVDGTAVNVDLDCLAFIPLSGPGITSATTMIMRAPTEPPLTMSPLGGGIEGILDGNAEGYWSRNTGTNVILSGTPTMSGGFPTADPAAAKNLLVLAAMDNGWSTAEESPPWISSKGATCSVQVSYQPRYLHLVGDR
jgi:hypothetical protein